MNDFPIRPVSGIRGEMTVPGDKSISHRGVMLGSIATGVTRLRGFLNGADCRATIRCFQELGVEIEQSGDEILVHGKGLYGLSKPKGTLDVKNSGTTMRLMSGLLCAQDFSCRITGDASIQKRPMKRIMDPLSLMGASIVSEKDNGAAPLRIEGAPLRGIIYRTPVASAQVKSAILLAGLYADGDTTVIEPSISRDHTERMLSAYGASLRRKDEQVTLFPGEPLLAQDILIPGDISSAAPFIAAGLLAPKGSLVIRSVNINPTRAGILTVVERMGGNLRLANPRLCSGEEVADLEIFPSYLSGVTIEGDLIPRLIDELPVIAVLAAFANGKTIVRDAAELRVKESDRIALLCDNLSRMGAVIAPREDGFVINGGRPLKGVEIHTMGDHRMAMACAIAGLFADGETIFDDDGCVDVSFPGFFTQLREISEGQ